jgi:nicotinamidase-related amidase
MSTITTRALRLLVFVSALGTPALAGAQAPKLKLLDADDAALLLLDHQTGLFQTVKDVPVDDLRRNAVVLARAAGLAKVPVITTASEPNGPNGPLMPELAEAAPDATYVPRKGEVSAWENADFVRTVKATGRKTLIMAGVWTGVCVVFPAIQAKAEGYDVYAVIDASGDPSPMASQVSLARLVQAGIVPITTNVALSELHRTWNRPDAAKWGELYGVAVPNYRAAIDSFQKAREVGGGR